MKKNKIFRKAMSLLLSVAILVGTFSICLPYLKIDAGAAGEITVTYDDGTKETITQERVVGVTNNSYEKTYSLYSTYYLNGAGEATDIVIPGLHKDQDYVIQGLSYYPAKDWMIVTAYHNDGTNPSKMFCLDAKTGDFVAMFSFLNPDGTPNLDHGGGIAFSENNIYYSCGDKDRKIAYAPLSRLDDLGTNGLQYKEVKLEEAIEFYEVGSKTEGSATAYTAYVCYDDGFLWMGNFFDEGTDILGMGSIAADYKVGATSKFNSMVYGYKLEGSSPEEEWNYLKGTYVNRLNVTNASGSGTANGSNHIWTATQNGEAINIIGSISAPTAYVGEFTDSFGSATLTEGVTYKIEFDSTNDKTDMYMFSPAGTPAPHCNVKQSSATTITENADGTYHYSMTFTAGLRPNGADSTWPTTQSTDGSYTGTYTLRFDQDDIEAGETRNYEITNVRVSVAKDGGYSYEAGYRGTPSQAVALENNIKDVQYAVAHNGKLYLSCSYGSGAGNSVNFGFGETSKLIVADIDLSATPDTDVTISTSIDNATTKTIKAHYITEYDSYDMMPMSEGLCIINDLIFCTFEGASNKYMNESSGLTSIGNCEKPVDVIWKIDPYALKENVNIEDNKYLHYEKVNSLSEIENGEEYIIVYESPVKDPVTQRKILYALDANGGYHDYKLSKSLQGDVKGYTGAIAHPITEYSFEGEKLYLSNPEKDDVRNIRWKLTNLTNTPTDKNDAFTIENSEFYFVNYPNFYCDASTISMATDNLCGQNMYLQESGDGEGGFWISNNQTYFLWCNDGTTESYNNSYNNLYHNSTIPMYSGIEEQPGTFHTDGTNASKSNVLGGSVVTTEHRIFYIYKRVVDKTATTYESRVYTGMQAELQADGTYTIDLETYAISPNHYEYVGERPTDYIIALDASTSVNDTQDGTGIISYNGNLSVATLCQEADTKDDKGQGVVGYSLTNEQIYFKHGSAKNLDGTAQEGDGKYYRVYLAVNNITLEYGSVFGVSYIKSIKQLYWVYYIADDGKYYVLMSAAENGGTGGCVAAGVDRSTFYSNVNSGVAYSGYSTNTSNGTRRETINFVGPHYKFAPSATGTPLDTTKAKAQELVDEIIANGDGNDRIAVTHYGAASYYLNTSNSWATSGFTDALWAANSTNAATLKNQIASITSSGNQTDNTGMELAFTDNIISASGTDYSADGDRNVCVIFMTDGIPGSYDGANTTDAANAVIAKAKTIKDKGAFIYTVVLGADDNNFDKYTYMSAVSSRHPNANNMTDLGGRNVDGIEYFSTLADCTINSYLNFASIQYNEMVKNDSVGIATLDAESILYEELSSAFKPLFDENGHPNDGIEIEWSLVPGSYDKVERFSFDESKKITEENAVEYNKNVSVTPDASNTRGLTITGYSYDEDYISKGKKGYKLKIHITGVLADEEADITNTSINNTTTTAIYQESDSENAFKYFPTEYFNIPTYTYVLDYDLLMYDKDINGTLCSVDSGLNKQSTYKTSRETDNVALNFKNNNLDMTYELVSGEFTEEENRSYCLIKRDDGTYDWFRINIVPASNVLFEEQSFTATSTTSSYDKSSWSLDGSALKDSQTLSGDNDRYGYDEVYANNGAGYSNGTVYKTTVNSTKKRSETMTFSYTGTGFDLMAACGKNTGIQLVNIKKITIDESGKTSETIEKVFMVDTYYVDAENNYGELLKQVPIVNYTNAGGYGTYTVEVTAAYLSTAQGVTGGRTSRPSINSLLNGGYSVQSLLKAMDIDVPADEVEYIWFNDNSILNGGTGPVATGSGTRATTGTDVALDCYIDGIRVYHPLTSEEEVAYYINSEKGATYHNVIGELATVENDDVITSNGDLFAYVVGTPKGEDGNAVALSFENYQSVGPQHELYLQAATGGDGSHSVAFNVQLANADSRVMISLRAVNGSTTAKIVSTNGQESKAIEYEIKTATEQYFDITPYLCIDTTTGKANVIITNTGDGLLSVNNLKLTGAAAAVPTSEDLAVMEMSYSIAPITVEPNSYDYNAVGTDDVQQPDVDEPADDPVDDGNDVEVPVVEGILAKIFAFLKKLFAPIFNIF